MVNNLFSLLDDIEKQLSPEDRVTVSKVDTATLHHSIGHFIRNEYGLWDKNSVLHKHFREVWMIGHPDDMSGVILDSLQARLNNRPLNVGDYYFITQKYRRHWNSFGIDPITQEKI